MSSIYLSNAIFMMIILTIIFLRIRYYITWSQSKKYTMIFIGMVELYVLMDALFMKELLGKSGNLLQFKLVVFFFYLVYVIMPYVWHLFMQSYMGINRSKKQRFAEMIPFILLVLMVLLSVPTGIVWRFSRNRTYIRGTFFGVFAVLNLFYYVYTFAQTFFILFMNKYKGCQISHKIGTVFSSPTDWNSGKYLYHSTLWGVSVSTVLPGNRSTALLPVHGGAPARSDGV